MWHNIIGYIDNGAPQTVVIGANYERYSVQEISNVSDTGKTLNADKASGTAVLIELAKTLSKSKSKNNFLFIVFSGNEPGSGASEYWLSNPGLKTPINYMIQVDEVCHYNPERKLSVAGYKT